MTMVKSLLDLFMEEITCHEMVIPLSQIFRSTCMLSLFVSFALFVSFKDAERMIIVKTREM